MKLGFQFVLIFCFSLLSDCRSFQNFISNANPETLAALNGAKAGEVSPDMVKAASNMIGKMSPEELQRMLQMASSFQGATPFTAGGSSDSSFNGFKSGVVPPNVTPDMLRTASDTMNKMSPEEIQKMFEMASSLRGNGSVPAVASALNTDRSSLGARSKPTETREKFAVNGNNGISETSSSHDFFSSSRNAPPSSFPASTSDMQEQMRNQMKDPAMQQVWAFISFVFLSYKILTPIRFPFARHRISLFILVILK
jgi:hypothetical protein